MSVAESVLRTPLQQKQDVVLERAELVTPVGIQSGMSVLLSEGRIARIDPQVSTPGARHVDARGLLLCPGFIDLHSDAIEKEIRPRPGGSFPVEVALTELDKRLAACGITSMYHCLCFGEGETNDLRTARVAGEIARTLQRLQPHLHVRNRIHARFEVSDLSSVPHLAELLYEGAIQLFSIMDHTPGQGQFTEMKHFLSYYAQAEHLSREQAQTLAAERMATRDSLGDEHIRTLCEICRVEGIPIASHDDDTPEKVRYVQSLGVTLSEFPVRLDAAREACRLGMEVLMGAPNILRGHSLTGNLSGREAIEKGVCTVVGSDYSPMSMFHAVMTMHREALAPLHELVNMLSINPARALGLDAELGAVEEGYLADLLLVDPDGPVPRIIRTFVGGEEVYTTRRSV